MKIVLSLPSFTSINIYFFQVKSRAFNFSSRCRMNEAAIGKKIIFRLKPFAASPLFVLTKTKAPVSFEEEVGIFAFYLF